MNIGQQTGTNRIGSADGQHDV